MITSPKCSLKTLPNILQFCSARYAPSPLKRNSAFSPISFPSPRKKPSFTAAPRALSPLMKSKAHSRAWPGLSQSPGLVLCPLIIGQALVRNEARLVAADALDFLAKVHGFLPCAKRSGDGPVGYTLCTEIGDLRRELNVAERRPILVR